MSTIFASCKTSGSVVKRLENHANEAWRRQLICGNHGRAYPTTEFRRILTHFGNDAYDGAHFLRLWLFDTYFGGAYMDGGRVEKSDEGRLQDASPEHGRRTDGYGEEGVSRGYLGMLYER
jgi:hypothetical protein